MLLNFINLDQGKSIIEIIIMLLVAYLLGVITNWTVQKSNASKVVALDEQKKDYSDLVSKFDELYLDNNQTKLMNDQLNMELNKQNLINRRLEKAVNTNVQNNAIFTLQNEKTHDVLHSISIKKEEMQQDETLPTTLLMQLPTDDNLQNTEAPFIALTAEENNAEIEPNEQTAAHIISIDSKDEAMVSTDNSAEINIENNKDKPNFISSVETKNNTEQLEEKYENTEKNEENVLEKIITTDATFNNIEKNSTNESTPIISSNESEVLSTDASLTALIQKIGTPKVENDLKLITGIGPFIEQKLYELDIKSYLQISKLRENDIDVLNELIQFFPGRIQRDNWVAQAKILLND